VALFHGFELLFEASEGVVEAERHGVSLA